MTAKPLTEAELEASAGWNIRPHPDGKPWAKCCGDRTDSKCACRKHTMADLKLTYAIRGSSRIETILWSQREEAKTSQNQLKRLIEEDGRFMCCHQTTEDGYHRECAGWAIKYRKPTTEKSNEDNS